MPELSKGGFPHRSEKTRSVHLTLLVRRMQFQVAERHHDAPKEDEKMPHTRIIGYSLTLLLAMAVPAYAQTDTSCVITQVGEYSWGPTFPILEGWVNYSCGSQVTSVTTDLWINADPSADSFVYVTFGPKEDSFTSNWPGTSEYDINYQDAIGHAPYSWWVDARVSWTNNPTCPYTCNPWSYDCPVCPPGTTSSTSGSVDASGPTQYP
jgi:hypothetical protein